VTERQAADDAAECPAAVGRPVVGEEAPDRDALGPEPAQSADQEAGGGARFLVCQDLGVDQAGSVVDRDVQDLPADPAPVVPPIAGRSVARAADDPANWTMSTRPCSKDRVSSGLSNDLLAKSPICVPLSAAMEQVNNP
jgi:hypothetical protein